jgi:TctA family transporter
MEEFLRRALLLSKGSPMVLVTRPISATMLVVAVLIMTSILLPALRKKREEVFVDDD